MLIEILNSKPIDYGTDKKFHVSGISNCLRKTFLQMKGLYKEEYSLETKRTFGLGNYVHDAIRSEIFEKASAQDFNVVACEINIPDNKYIGGKIDLILSNIKTGELIVVDIKSAGKWTLNKVREGIIPDAYINQVQLYLHFMKLKRGFLLFVGKEKGEVLEHEIIYDKEKCEKLIAYIENFMINFVEKDIEPPKCDGGDWGCSVCGIAKGKLQKW